MNVIITSVKWDTAENGDEEDANLPNCPILVLDDPTHDMTDPTRS